ncbi:hypothetical protein D3C77_632920 [compost metagenome]
MLYIDSGIEHSDPHSRPRQLTKLVSVTIQPNIDASIIHQCGVHHRVELNQRYFAKVGHSLDLLWAKSTSYGPSQIEMPGLSTAQGLIDRRDLMGKTFLVFNPVFTTSWTFGIQLHDQG